MPRVAVLDGFRAYAIIGVVLLHLLGLSGALDTGSDTRLIVWGVAGNVIDFFFIISGFVLFLPVVRRGGTVGPVGRYALGRATRLVPGYWLCIAVMLVLIAATSYGEFVPFPTVYDLAGNMAALQMPLKMLDTAFPIGLGQNGALWMISIIVGFYCVLPLIAGPYFRHPLIGLGVAAAITLVWKLAVQEVPGVFEWLDRGDGPQLVAQLVATDQLPGWAFSFALGMTGAWAYTLAYQRGTLDRASSFVPLVAAVAVVVYAACSYAYGSQANDVAGPSAGNVARLDPALTIPFALARAMLVAVVVLGPLWLRRPFDNASSRWITKQSYGVYLIHLVVAGWIGLLLLELPRDGSIAAVAQWFGVVIPLSALYAWLSLNLFERPVQRLIGRWRT